jgi:hypothetical protein
MCHSPLVVKIIVLSESIEHIQLRILLTDLSFIDVYYHQESGKTSYTQILDNKRIFAADNKRHIWHWHPREDPSQHIEAGREISFDEFLVEIEKAIQT